MPDQPNEKPFFTKREPGEGVKFTPAEPTELELTPHEPDEIKFTPHEED